MYRDAWTSSMHLVTAHCPVEPFGRLSRSLEIDHQIELKRSLAATFPTNMDSASEQPKFMILWVSRLTLHVLLLWQSLKQMFPRNLLYRKQAANSGFLHIKLC